MVTANTGRWSVTSDFYLTTFTESSMTTKEFMADVMELQSIDEDVRELEELFGHLGLQDGKSQAETPSELEALNLMLAGTEFETDSGAESSSSMSFLEMIDADPTDIDLQEGFFGDIWDATTKTAASLAKSLIKGKANKWIKKIVRLVKKHGNLIECAPSVVAAVAAFKAGKYGAALTSAYATYQCIQQRL